MKNDIQPKDVSKSYLERKTLISKIISSQNEFENLDDKIEKELDRFDESKAKKEDFNETLETENSDTFEFDSDDDEHSKFSKPYSSPLNLKSILLMAIISIITVMFANIFLKKRHSPYYNSFIC